MGFYLHYHHRIWHHLPTKIDTPQKINMEPEQRTPPGNSEKHLPKPSFFRFYVNLFIFRGVENPMPKKVGFSSRENSPKPLLLCFLSCFILAELLQQCLQLRPREDIPWSNWTSCPVPKRCKSGWWFQPI